MVIKMVKVVYYIDFSSTYPGDYGSIGFDLQTRF